MDRAPISGHAGLLAETPEEIAEAITRLSAYAARMPDHWVDRRAAAHARIDTLLDELIAHRGGRSGRPSTCTFPEQDAQLCEPSLGAGPTGAGGGARTRFYRPHERPVVEVLVEDVWYSGELRMWTRHKDGSWSANVTWGREDGETCNDTFPA
jgi:hypothetical protein